MKSKILEVVAIDLQVSKINPPILVITASGHVSSTGWTSGELIPYVYIMPPADGIYEFDFVASPSTGMSPQIIMPIDAVFSWPSFPDNLVGVRIYAAHNKLEEKISNEGEKLFGGGGEAPRGLSVANRSASHNITLNAIVIPEKNGKKLIVHGSIITYRDDDKITISRAVPQGINPMILLLKLKITTGNGPMKGTAKPFLFELTSEDDFHYTKVSLIYGAGALISTDITVHG